MQTTPKNKELTLNIADDAQGRSTTQFMEDGLEEGYNANSEQQRKSTASTTLEVPGSM